MTPTTTETIWQKLSDDLRRYIRRRVADEHAVEDLLQELFLKIHHHLKEVNEPKRLAAWVYQIARNVIIDHYRKQSSDAPLSLIDDPSDKHRIDEASKAQNEIGSWLMEMVEHLPKPYQEAIRLSELEGLSQKQIAHQIGISYSGAKSRIQRGRKLLKEELDRCCSLTSDSRGNLTEYKPRVRPECCDKC